MATETNQQATAAPKAPAASKILRFHSSERLLHWALAIPFLICLTSALVLMIHYNPDPTRPYRAVFAATHRLAGIAFIVLPILATIISKGDFKIHFYNIRQAWLWTLHDIKWLLLMGVAAVNKKIVLPEQGKFNAAEKLNFMYLMSTYAFYVLSGFYIWLTDAAFVAWIIHCGIAVLSIPLILGHIYMATINAGSRVGLSGMFTGYVDRHWAKHHYSRWFREHFETEEPVIEPVTKQSNRIKSHAEGAPQDTKKSSKLKPHPKMAATQRTDQIAQDILASLQPEESQETTGKQVG